MKTTRQDAPHFLENWLKLKVKQRKKEFNKTTKTKTETKKNVRTILFYT